MKKILYICVLILLSFNLMAQKNTSLFMNNKDNNFCILLEKYLNFQYSTSQIPIADGWLYESSYSDEFNGTSLDLTKWWMWNDTYHDNNPYVGYIRENVHVNNGKLVLSAYYDPVGYTVVNHTNIPQFVHYLTGGIESARSIRYGYFEVECYLPKNHKFRPCFWLWSPDGDKYNEVDVFEITPIENSPYGIQQNAYTDIESSESTKTCQHLTISDSITGKTTRFGVEVLPYEIVYYINGRVSSHLIYDNDQANSVNIFTCSDIMKMVPMDVTLTFTMTVDNGMPQPYEDFTVNYFRCYKMDRGSQNTYHPTTFTPSAESCKVYPYVILGGSGHTAVINTSTAVWAEQSIILDKGFELSAGNTFSARVIKHGTDNPEISPLYIGNYQSKNTN